MRVLVQADMEGAAQIDDFRECFPYFPEYWRTGRHKLTADVVAAVAGLFAGGATAVVVRNSHGLPDWPNVLPEALPPRAELEAGGFGAGPARRTFDATFQVGRHARCGTRDGFLSHTGVYDFRVAVDGAPITESHGIAGAWSVGAPVLGITGDAALGRELDGGLTGTPFLAVKRSTSRSATAPIHADPAAGAAAIRAFARDCARRWRERPAPRLPGRFAVEISLDRGAAAQLAGQHGLTRTSPCVLRLDATDWQREAAPAVGAAAGAAAGGLLAALAGLDLTTEATMQQQPPERLAAARRAFADFAAADYAAWRTE